MDRGAKEMDDKVIKLLKSNFLKSKVPHVSFGFGLYVLGVFLALSSPYFEKSVFLLLTFV